MAGLTDSAVAVFDSEDGVISVASFEAKDQASLESALQADPIILPREGNKVEVGRASLLPLSDEDIRALDRLSGDPAKAGRVWRGFEMPTAAGRRDRVALALDPEIDVALTRAFIQRVWPLLRSECLAHDALVPPADATIPGVEWDLLNRLDVAIFILDGAGLMYRKNRAARDLLDAGGLLRRGRRGLTATTEAATRTFRAALAGVAEGGEEGRIEFLPRESDGKSVPVTLTRYVHEGQPTRFVVATIPLPPARDRVEALGRKLGLTSVEARVAALIQLGLTNREAAGLAGLKEQTFNTYAKRVLSKLGFACRTEMAQFLTWQAAGGRLS